MPVGALSATYTDSLIINMLGFYFIALPLFLFGLFFWGTIGKKNQYKNGRKTNIPIQN